MRVKDRSSAVREHVAEGVTKDQLVKAERRRMDRHNRPSHQMAATAERAVDAAMTRADIPTTRRRSPARRRSTGVMRYVPRDRIARPG